MKNIWRSGIIFTLISFLTGMGNLVFQVILGRHLKTDGQFGDANSAINGFVPLLALLPSVAIFAVTHYIAHFKSIGDNDRLQGLLVGCRKFLVRLTIIGSLLAIIVVKPLSSFFHYNERMMIITLICTLLGLWMALATALCQGMAWFKRLALLGFLAMLLRIVFGWFVTLRWPSPETAVLASTVGLFAYLILLVWRKDFLLPGRGVSPWGHEFTFYLVISAASVVGSYCFLQGDLLVIQRYFSDVDRDAYTAAERFAFALPTTVAPLLTVLFTHRSVEHTAAALREQLKLLGLYTVGLIFGAGCLLVLRVFLLKVLGKYTPEAASMLVPLAVSMTFVGLIQAVGIWALASRWSRICLLYGGLGIIYLATLFFAGKTPATLLQWMPMLTSMAFVILFSSWFIAAKRHKPVQT